MPVLQVAIDASKAKTGADEAASATTKIATGAKKADVAVSGLQRSMDGTASSMNKWIIPAQNMDAAFAATRKRLEDMAVANGKMERSATEASLVYENMTAAIKQADAELAKSAQVTKSAGASTTELSKAVADTGKTIQQTEPDRKNFSEGWERVGKNVKLVTNLLLGMSAGVAAVYAFKQVISYITEFEKELAKLRGVVQGTDEDMRRLADAARYAGATTIFNAVEASQGLLLLAQAGFSVDQSIRALPATLSLATAGVVSLEEAAGVVSNTINQFALSTRQADRVADIFVNTANETNTNVMQLAEALEYTGPIAAAYGKSLEETSAALGVLSNRGIQASIAGTNLRGIFAALGGLTPKATETIKELGLTVEQVDPQMNSLTEIFQRFSAAGLTASQATEIFNRRNGSAALILAAAASEIDKLTKANQNASGVAQKNATIIENSLYGAFKKFKSIVQDVFLAVGEGGLVGALSTLANTATDVLKVLVGIEDGAKDVSNTTYVLAGAVKFLLLSLTGLVAVRAAAFLWSLLPPLAAGTTAMYTMGAAVRSLWLALGPAGWLVLGISALITVVDYLETAMDDSAKALDRFHNKAEDLSASLETLEEIMARRKFAIETQDIEGQLNAARRIQEFFKNTGVELIKRGDKGGSLVQIEDLNRIVQSVEGQKQLNELVQQYQRMWVEQGKPQDSPFLGIPSKELERQKQIWQEADKFINSWSGKMSEVGDVLSGDPLGTKYFEKFGKQLTSFQTPHIFAVTMADALKLMKDEMERSGKAADDLAVSLKALNDEQTLARQNEIVDEYISKLKEEQKLIPMTAAEKKGELTVREAVAKATEAGIKLTDDQISKIRQEAEVTQNMTDAQAACVQAEKDLQEEMKRTEKAREDAIKSLEDMVRNFQQETEVLRLSGVEKDKLSARYRAEAVARGQNIANIEEYIRLLDAEIEKQAEIKKGQERDKAIEDLDKYISKLNDEIELLGLEGREKDAQVAQMRAEEIARGKNIQNLDEYISKIRLAAYAVYDLKEAQEKEKERRKGETDASRFERDLSNEYDLVGSTDHEKSRGEKMSKYQDALQKAYQLTNDEMEQAQRLSKGLSTSEGEYGEAVGTVADRIAAYRAELEKLDQAKKMVDLANDMGKAFGDAFADIITGAKSAGDAMKALYSEIVRLVVQQMVAIPIASMFSSVLKSAFVPSEDGNIFYGGRLQPFAYGGVVSGPTVFPMANGKTGLMGEAGPEAVMPLTRGRDGKLGVRSNGGTQQNVTVHMTVNTPNADSFRRSSSMVMDNVRRATRRP